MSPTCAKGVFGSSLSTGLWHLKLLRTLTNTWHSIQEMSSEEDGKALVFRTPRVVVDVHDNLAVGSRKVLKKGSQGQREDPLNVSRRAHSIDPLRIYELRT